MIKQASKGGIQVIDLDGPEGNAFTLIGYARKLGRQLGMDGERIAIEMRQGDYTQLVQTFDRYFGDYVVLETSNSKLLEAS